MPDLYLLLNRGALVLFLSVGFIKQNAYVTILSDEVGSAVLLTEQDFAMALVPFHGVVEMTLFYL